MTAVRPVHNCGVCERCRKRVPAEHAVRDGKIYLQKHCPDCGLTEAIVSSDAEAWQQKRDIWRYDPNEDGCGLTCTSCEVDHHPRIAFLDITNRCNMNCAICIANIPGMGFLFEPPLSYFENVLAKLGQCEPKPTVQLFGGEPTMREDLFEIIAIARRHGLRVRIVTNGLRLADEEFCRKLCEADIPVLLSYDGASPEIYERLRGSPGACEKKMKAFENLKKYSKRKNTIMCCVARGVNDHLIRGIIDACHEAPKTFGHLHMIPLTQTWQEGEIDVETATTLEEAENIVAEAFPGETVEFLPAGIGHRFGSTMRFFGSPRLTFGGVHPNCESATVFVSDGERYHPLTHFLRRPLKEVVEQAIRRADRIEPKLERLDPSRAVQRWRGRWLVLRTFGGLLCSTIDWRKLMKGNRFLAMLRIAAGLAAGRKLRNLLRRHTHAAHALTTVVLPFEEYHSADGQRLRHCAAAYAFEDPKTGRLRFIPVCAASLYKDDLERAIAAKYAAEPADVPSSV